MNNAHQHSLFSRLRKGALASVAIAALALGGLVTTPAFADDVVPVTEPAPVVETVTEPVVETEPAPIPEVVPEPAPVVETPAAPEAPAAPAAPAAPEVAETSASLLAVVPALTVSASPIVADTSVQINVAGTGFDAVTALPGQAKPTIYTMVVEKGRPLSEINQADAPAKSLYATAGAINTDGEGSPVGPLVYNASYFDKTKEYEVITWPSRSNPSDSNVYARADLTIDWDALFPAPVFEPVLTVTPNEDLATDAPTTVTVSGTGYDPSQAIYVFLCADTALPADLFAHAAGCRTGAKVVYPSTDTNPSRVKFAADGSFTIPFDVSQLNDGATAVFTAANHTGPTVRTQDAKVVLDFAPPAPVFDPQLTVTPNEDLATDAPTTVTVSGTGYDPSQAIYVFLCADTALPADLWAHAMGCRTGAKVVYPSTDTNPSRVKFAADGSFTISFDVSQIDGGATAVFTAANHTGPTVRTQDAKVVLDFAPATPVFDPQLSVTPNEDLATDAPTTVTVSGTGYDPSQAIYVFLCADTALPADLWAHAMGCRDGAKVVYPSTDTNPSRVKLAADGSFTIPFTVSQLNGGATAVFTAANHTGPTVRTQDAKVVLDFAEVVPVVDPKVTVTPSVVNPNAEGSTVISVSGTGYLGAGAANGVYVNLGTATQWQPGDVPAEGGWVVSAWVPAASIVNGAFSVSLTIPEGSLDESVAYGVSTFAAHGLSLTDRSLDVFEPITLDFAAPSVSLDRTSVVAGGTITVTGTGFAEGTSVTAAVHSSPVHQLGAKTADASGTVTWTWTIPSDMTTGAHTARLSVDGVEVARAAFTVTAGAGGGTIGGGDTGGQDVCVANAVGGASFSWGVKQSFVSYVQGSIAKGSASIGWGGGSGQYNPSAGFGLVSFGGGASFTGHGGILNVQLSNPQVHFTGPTTARLLLDVSATNTSGQPAVNQSGVFFASLNLGAASRSGGGSSVTFAGIPATLTSAGAAAFGGFYSAGEALDTVSVTLPLGAEEPCREYSNPASYAPGGTLANTGSTSGDSIAVVALGLALLGGLAVLVARRRSSVTSR